MFRVRAILRVYGKDYSLGSKVRIRVRVYVRVRVRVRLRTRVYG